MRRREDVDLSVIGRITAPGRGGGGISTLGLGNKGDDCFFFLGNVSMK